MRSRALLLLGLALVFGALAAFMVNQLSAPQGGDSPGQADSGAPGTAVVLADTDIARGETVTAEMLRVVRLPDDAYPESAFPDIGTALENPPVIAMTALSEGEVLLPDRLSTGMRSRGITGRIPEGYRAIAIPVNAVRGVAGFVLPGTRVDILHTTSVGRQDGQPVTRTLLQDIMVLSINQETSEVVDDPVVGSVASLLASPDEAKALLLAQEVGQLTMALRNDMDDEVTDRANTITLDDLWTLTPEEQMVAAEAARQRAQQEAREAARRAVGIIRGVQVSEQIVSSGEGSPADAGRPD